MSVYVDKSKGLSGFTKAFEVTETAGRAGKVKPKDKGYDKSNCLFLDI